jgi:predicted alpha/beta-fold hydrolase
MIKSAMKATNAAPETWDEGSTSDPVLARLNLPDFHALPGFENGTAQTLLAHFWPREPAPEGHEQHLLKLGDGDRLLLLEDRPAGWEPGARVVVLVHGLGGSSESAYMIRMSKRLLAAGCLVVRVNLRGAGLGAAHAKLPYHSGRSEDLRAVAEWLHKRFPASPVTQIGFSLGGNLTLKLAAEMGAESYGGLDSFAAVSPPIDLAASSEKIAGKRVFDRNFVSGLRQHVGQIHRSFRELPPPDFPKRMTLRDFDELYTAPRSGFGNAAEYYARASAGPLLPRIGARTLLLYSADDPLIDTLSLRVLRSQGPLEVVSTDHGGHVGFIGRPFGGKPLRWMDELLCRWVASL